MESINKKEGVFQVIIADDHPIFRKGLREIVEMNHNFEVIAEAESGEKALEYYYHFEPDIIILDISMGSTNGLEVAEKILSTHPNAFCVMMTMYNEEAFCRRALSLGVRAYLLKDDVADAIQDCLEAVTLGKKFISKSLGDIDKYTKPNTEMSPESVLTEKEIAILTAIAQLKTNKEIAQEHFISHRTVQNHRQNICNKLELSGRQALLQFAIKWMEQKTI